MHQNINGLMNKSELLSIHIDELERNNKTPDVICITEHNMLNSDTNLLKVPNYFITSCFARNTRRGGSCILVHKSHKYEEIVEIKESSIAQVIECSAIKLNTQI